MEASYRSPDYRPDIDGLRAVAVLPVVAFHAFPGWMPGGFVGVDVFFVISGFLITRDILHRQTAGNFTIGGFYRRRAHRLFPALAVVLASTLLAGLLVLFRSERHVLLGDLAASAGFVLNHWLVAHQSYFDTQAPLRPLLHLWSLAVEEQFYLLWPWILIVMRGQPGWSRLLVASVLALASFAACVLLQAHQPEATYYLLPTRAWQLLIGALLALQSTSLSAASLHARRWAGLACAAGAGLLAASLLTIDAQRPYPGIAALAPTLGAVLLLTGTPVNALGNRLLSQRWLVAVGRISYPLYLWHWPLLAFLRIHEGGSPGAVARVLAVAVAVVMATLTTLCIESRLRPISSARRTVGLVAAVGALGIVSLLGAGGGPAGPLPNDEDAQRLDDVTLYGPPPPGPPCSAPWHDRLPARAQCQQLGPAPSRAAVIGDSHAHHLFSGLQRADAKGRWSVLSVGSCPPLVGVRVRARWLDCGDRGETLVRIAAADRSLDTVVLAFLGSHALDSNLAAEHVLTGVGPAGTVLTDRDDPGLNKPAAFAAGLRRSVQLLLQAGKRVAIVIDVPELPFDPRGCLQRPLLGRKVADCSVPRDAVMRRQAVLRQTLQELAARHPQVLLLDALQVLCDDIRCRVEQDGMILMRDSHHLSARGSARVAGALLRMLQVSPAAARSTNGR